MTAGLDHLSDTAVLARMARGDKSALDALYRRFGHLAYGLAREIVRDDEAAEEIVGAAFADLWQQAPHTKPTSDPRSELLCDVHRRSAELVRSTDRRPERTSTHIPHEQPRWVSLEAQTGGQLLDQLSDSDREALELAYYGCYTRDEIASMLGISIQETTTRISNAMHRLGELQQEGAPSPPKGASLHAVLAIIPLVA